MRETETSIHQSEDMQQAFNEYCEYLQGFGIKPPQVDFAFRSKVRTLIKTIAGNSPYPGYDFEENECSHFDHDKSNPDYNTPENGHLVNKPEHYVEHRMSSEGEFDNGLPPHQDSWAARQIWGRMSDDQKAYLAMKAGQDG